MLDIINGLANGWVVSHVIDSFARRGILEAMSVRSMTLKKIASRYRGNAGHLHAALRLLYELGWVEWIEPDRYGAVAGAGLARQLPSDLLELLQLPLAQALATEQSDPSERLLRWLDRCGAEWGGVDPAVASVLDGALLAPLLVQIDTLGGDVLEQTQPSNISTAALQAVRTLFIQRGWGQVEAASFQLTPSGRALLANSGALGTVVSYTPMLRHLDDLLFGEARAIFGTDEQGHEWHVDRTVHAIASGVQHQRHFAELDTLILRIFDQAPLATQPRYIADMGCGDGSLLLRIYQLIKTRSARGRALAEYPLTLIGVEDNALSLDATEKTLAGLPHLLVRGRIADPQQLITDLAAAGIEDPENILHVRAFLDHERPFLSIEDKRAARRREGLNYTGVYIARDGSEIKPAHAVQGLVEHLRRWRMAISRFGLLSLEAHCLRPNTVKCLGNMTESAHFDAFKAFSGQQLVEASVFLMAAAEVGLFPEPGLSRTFPERLNFTRLSLHRLIPQPYTIRHPVRADLSRLKHLNRMCEPSAMRISTAEIKRRVCDVPQQQMVLEFAGQIAAVLYTQRIDSVAALRSICYAEVGCLCQAEGRYVQLLGLFVAPEMHGRGFSDALLDLMLVYGSLLDGVEAIVGVTRCAHYSQYQAEYSLDRYIELRDEQGQWVDPMLHFHTSHGAVIREVLPGFRPGDTDNEGAGVLIEYRLRSEQKTAVETADPQAVSTDTTRAVNQVEPIVRSAVIEVLGSQRAPAYDPQAPLMEMGLSSLELLELRRRLSTRLGESLPSTFFFSYGTSEAIIGYFMAQAAVQLVTQTTVTPAPQASTVPARGAYASASDDLWQESTRQDQAVAIIGVACRLPDRVNTPAQFWQELLAARDGVGALPAHRQVLWGSQAEPCRWQAGFLAEVECFDAGFFRISPREAKLLDPQQRLLLEVAWEAVESAAIAPATLRGTRSGVFVGMMGSDYEDVITRNGSKADINAYFATGNACSVAAGRLSYFFDWQGPALSIDTACSSSLVAVHTACRSLLGGECTLALAAGVNLLLDDKRFLAYEQAGMLSPHGRCRTFDASADGYVRGEGCAAVVLKRLSDAQADEDPIMAVIRGSAINQDGSSSGLTAPNQLAQQAVIEAALAQAGLAPHEIGYLEAHGTGTKLGDPIEVMAAAQVLGAGRSADQPLLIGSLKSVMGHLEAAAGIAGLIKTVLSMQQGVIPAQLHFETPNPYIPWQRLPMQVVAQTQRWPAGLKRAGVSSFGFSGTNAHVIVEEYSSPQKASTMLSGPVIVVLSAKNEERLRDQVQQLLSYLEHHTETNLTDLAYTLQVGREALDVRLALVVRSINELKERLLGYAQGKASQENIYQGELKHAQETLAMFQADEDQQKWLAKGELDKLAQLWTQGLKVAWGHVYGAVKPKRISLPTYPFAKERYWVLKAVPDPVVGGEQVVPGRAQLERTCAAANKPGIPHPTEGVTGKPSGISLCTLGTDLCNDVSAPVESNQYVPTMNHKTGRDTTDSPAEETSNNRPASLKILQEELTKTLAKVLYLEYAEIDAEYPFVELGLDSITGVEWAQLINQSFGLSLPVTRLYDYPTIRRLAEHLSPMVLSAQSAAVAHHPIAEDATDRSTRVPVASEIQPIPQQEGVAIIGMSGAFPKSKNLEEFWDNLVQGRDCVSEVPAQRWSIEQYYDPRPATRGRTYSKWMGELEEADCFDPLFFNISPAEAQSMDPQQRLFLEHSWSCIEAAGINPHTLSDSRCGVYVGCCASDYGQVGDGSELTAQGLLGNASSILSARIAYFLNLKGPCLALDAACSSSLVAIAEACDSLMLRQSDLVLAGGVYVSARPDMHIMTSSAGMLSKVGRCFTFDARADGFVPGEGVGVLLLKRLTDAVRDQDLIHGVLRGWGVNQDGRTNGITAPSVSSQITLQKQVYERFGINPETISLVEAHGTGTALGDPIEVEALTESFRSYTAKQDYCALGSVKSNIGHLLTAAGVSGVIKVLLALRHRVLPPTINFSTLNERITVAGSPFYINTDLKPWTVAGDQLRRAAVSSFGFSGTNAHLVLEEYLSSAPVGRVGNPQQVLLVLSAKTAERLQAYATKMKAWAEGETELDLTALAYTLQTGREAMVHRLALVVESRAQMLDALDKFTRGQATPGVFTGQAKKSSEHTALFEDDGDADALLQAWLRAKKLSKLAQLWVHGLTVEWGQLYGQTKPRRMSLPTYPFAKKRYWTPTRVVPNGLERQLHPLLHRNTSDLSQQRFSTTLTGKEFFLHDHVVQGQRIVPGAAQLEWARAAVALASHGEVGQTVMLQEVMWLRPLVVAQPREVHIGLESQEDGRIGFEIYSDSRDEAVVYSRGWAQWVAVGEAPQVDLEVVRAHCEQTVAGEACYAQFAQQGLEFGPSFQVLKELWLGDQVVVGALRLTADAPAGYVWAPNVLDGALQASVGLAQNKTNAPLALPFAVAQVRQWGELPMPAWAVVRPGVGDSAAVRKLDIDIVDANRRVALRLSGFSTRPLDGAISVHEAIEQVVAAPQTVLLAPQWAAQAPVQLEVAPVYERHGILVCEVGQDNPQRLAELAVALPAAQCLQLSGSGPLAQRYTAYAMQLLAWIQKEVAAHPGDRLLLQLVIPNEGESAVLQGLGGFLRSAQQEYPRLVCQVMAVAAEVSMPVLVQQLKAEAASPAPMVRYIEGKREVLGFAPMACEDTTLPWRDEGVYLITGGLGGLGQVFARTMAQQIRHPVLVLTGRRALQPAQERVLRELEGMGARVAYRAVDMSDAVAVAALVAEITAQYEQLNGVIHSAGVLHDGLLAQKSGETLQQVLAPKVAGLVALDEATQAVALDWLVLCSSVASVLGNVGQTDYAAANGFLDSYAQYRSGLVAQGQRQGHTVSVSWPLWAEGGMQIDAAGQERLRRDTGLEAMPSAVGIMALCQALGQSATHVVVEYGAVAHVLQRIRTTYDTLMLPATTRGVDADDAVAVGELQSQIEHKLTGLISAQLKIAREELERDTPLSEFGFDSITLTELGNALNQKYSLTLSSTIFFEYSTIAALAGYLAREHHALLAPAFAAMATAPICPESGTVSSLFTPVLRNRRGRVALAVQRGDVSERDTIQAESIAVIGMSGCFPQAENIDALWANLLAEQDSIGALPASRWAGGLTPAICHAGVIDSMDEFDPLFFGISPREAQAMDPQQRLLMLYVYRVIEDAGYSVRSLSGSATALLVGTSAGSGYGNLLAQAGETVAGYSAVGLAGSMGPNRMSYWLNWHGPSEPIDTACSSSLVAVHRALELLRSGQCTQAVVGGVNTLLSLEIHESFTQAGMLSQDGRCKTFSAQADGYVRGEGVGMVFLKPLSAAERDGDHIYGLIKGSATNHGGRANSLTAPNPRAQADLIKAALRQAGVGPETVGYIEAHGTGTELGDPIEAQGLKSAFAELAAELPLAYCGLGSVKSNLGHLELAAGVAGLIKVLLQLQHRTLVKSLHCEELNPLLALSDSPFYVVQQTRAWEALRDRQGQELPRRAGVSSFGFGGVNAHVIVEEYVGPPRAPTVFSGPVVVILSARNEAQLRDQAQQLLTYLERQAEVNLVDLAYTLQVGREALRVRLALVTSSISALQEQLAGYVRGEALQEDTIYGEVKREQGILAAFRADEDLQKAIEAWVAKGKVGKLAQLWVQGLEVDWGQLYAQTKPQRMSLPTYPFAKERYWVPQNPVLLADGVLGPELSIVAVDELQSQIEHGLTELISAHLKIAQEELERDAPLSEFGFDSITLTELGNALNQKYSLALSPTIFFEYSTIAALAGYLAREYQAMLAPAFAATVTAPICPESGPVSSLFTPAPRSRRKSVALATLRGDVSESKTIKGEPIAVIGMSGCFPQAEDIDTLWANLLAERDSIEVLPSSRWERGLTPSICHAGVIESIDEFDPLFFGISPREAQAMDPQQRLLMLYVYKVIEDAGYSVRSLSGSATALLVGTTAGSGYGNLLAQAGETVAAYSAVGLVGSMGPNRMSYWLNWHGPSEPIETACSSSLVAVHRALELLRSGQCVQAVVGGVNTLLSLEGHESLTLAGMLSKDGRCKAFSAQADGYVRAEGVGMVFLKPLSTAERDGDHIYGLLKGSAINHGGRANSLTAPNPRAQTDLIKAALQQAGVEPETIGYIEAHGTGTQLGDPIEVQGLKSAFAELASELPTQSCGLGTVKSNIGHLELAAGVVGLIKVLLQLQHRTLVKSLHCEELNPLLALAGSPFYVVQHTRAWEALSDRQGRLLPRRAGVSSFGFGGVNAHAIVEEYIRPQRAPTVFSGPVVVLLSARNEAQLRDQVQQLLTYLERQVEVNLVDLAYTLQVGREALGVRAAWVVHTVDALKAQLLSYVRGEAFGEGAYQGELTRSKEMLAAFRADEDMQRTIEAWVAKGKLNKLAQLWVQGLEVEWGPLYEQTKPRRMSLPTYPFAKEHYWVPQKLAQGGPEHQLHRPIQRPDLSEQHLTTIPTSDLDQARCAELNTGAVGRPQMQLEHILTGLISAQLKIAREELERDVAFSEFGFDSVILTEFSRTLNQKYGLSLSPAMFFKYSTIAKLADYFTRQHPALHAQAFGVTAASYANNDVVPPPSSQRVETPTSNTTEVESIAVVGMSGCFPQANTLQEYWDNLVTGRDCITEIPADRWSLDGFYIEDKQTALAKGLSYNKWGGFIRGLNTVLNTDFFTTAFEAQATWTDWTAEQKLFVQMVWTLLEAAGYTSAELNQVCQSRVGVYVGMMSRPMSLIEANKPQSMVATHTTNELSDMVSHLFKLQGPSLVIDAYSASSMVAIHMACASLIHGECEAAIAGGISLMHPELYQYSCQLNILGSHPQSRSFAANCDGPLFSDGAGVVLLKCLSKAIQDKDSILGVIKSTVANNVNNIALPNIPMPDVISNSIKENIIKSGLDPRTISYIEASAPGYEIGDALEVFATERAFREFTQEQQFCALGSLKPSIGHATAASGISQLIKVLLQMRHRQLAPTLQVSPWRSDLELEHSPFYLQQEAQAWHRPRLHINGTEQEVPRRAMINSIGYGNFYAGAIIEEYVFEENSDLREAQQIECIASEQLIVLSAKTAEHLKAMIEQLGQFTQSQAQFSLQDMAYTLQLGRVAMPLRWAAVVQDRASLLSALTFALQQKKVKSSVAQGRTIFASTINYSTKGGRARPGAPAETQMLQHGLAEKDLIQIAASWVKGANIAWGLLHKGQAPRRIWLPGYPFF
ncbi:SDR family NAD(P)-dependent oxidoreductase [Mycoavidus sp. SF9855]|uniref:SDR family NAD(P)-dependent oxidoreductase n=1 Tax=Mycoavidus sp. SF9855 TaxID=2968475 RepID=UPI00211B89C4|nr:SDR family NAD(P)-dependent oxidoreductase [Mycoavidus sp. SF9855]UUM22295.1 SDR family NAD(P)-dependent oxidoreductase [Mycoavidus sp. SF9855]